MNTVVIKFLLRFMMICLHSMVEGPTDEEAIRLVNDIEQYYHDSFESYETLF